MTPAPNVPDFYRWRLFMQWIHYLASGYFFCRVESFSPPLANEPQYQRLPLLAANGLKPEYGDAKNAEDGNDHSSIASESADIDISGIEEAQLLLACRAYLLRKHKLEWKQKKRRAEAAASPLFNEGYFWPDPNDLVYLREDPDPENLVYNETYAENYGYKRNGVRFLTSDRYNLQWQELLC